jgi:hypothetical protein
LRLESYKNKYLKNKGRDGGIGVSGTKYKMVFFSSRLVNVEIFIFIEREKKTGPRQIRTLTLGLPYNDPVGLATIPVSVRSAHRAPSGEASFWEWEKQS